MKTQIKIPKIYYNLIGRKFRDIGQNGMNRSFIIDEIVYKEFNNKGPWLAKCYPYGWDPPFKGPRYRKVDRFLDRAEYEEIT